MANQVYFIGKNSLFFLRFYIDDIKEIFSFPGYVRSFPSTNDNIVRFQKNFRIIKLFIFEREHFRSPIL